MVDKIQKICNECGKVFELLPYEVRGRLKHRKHPSNLFFCSTACSGAYFGKKKAESCLEKLGGIDYLRELYLAQKKSANEIGRQLNCSPRAIKDHLRSVGITIRPPREAMKLEFSLGRHKKGKHYPSWKPRRKLKKIAAGGYIFIYQPDHPRADQQGYIQEHIVIWEQTHNKSLPKGQVIHHLNGIRKDNRPENLIALSNKGHTRRELGGLYKKRIRTLEGRVKLLEKTLKEKQLIWDTGS